MCHMSSDDPTRLMAAEAESSARATRMSSRMAKARAEFWSRATATRVTRPFGRWAEVRRTTETAGSCMQVVKEEPKDGAVRYVCDE